MASAFASAESRPQTNKRRRQDSMPSPVEIPVTRTLSRVERPRPEPVLNGDTETLRTFTSTFEDFRSTITCTICLRLLYEPYTISCGHTHCYSCLSQWFNSNGPHGKTCPDCRAHIKDPPAPAYLVRSLTQKFIQHQELLPEGETVQEHEKWRKEECDIVETDKANLDPRTGGLFKNCFRKSKYPHPRRIYDAEDGVERCPECTWEIENGDGSCDHCGYSPEDPDDHEGYTDGLNTSDSGSEESIDVNLTSGRPVTGLVDLTGDSDDDLDGELEIELADAEFDHDIHAFIDGDYDSDSSGPDNATSTRAALEGIGYGFHAHGHYHGDYSEDESSNVNNSESEDGSEEDDDDDDDESEEDSSMKEFIEDDNEDDNEVSESSSDDSPDESTPTPDVLHVPRTRVRATWSREDDEDETSTSAASTGEDVLNSDSQSSSSDSDEGGAISNGIPPRRRVVHA